MNKNYFHAMSESNGILVEFTLSYISIRKWNLFSIDMSLFMACILQFALLHLMDWSLRLCELPKTEGPLQALTTNNLH